MVCPIGESICRDKQRVWRKRGVESMGKEKRGG